MIKKLMVIALVVTLAVPFPVSVNAFCPPPPPWGKFLAKLRAHGLKDFSDILNDRLKTAQMAMLMKKMMGVVNKVAEGVAFFQSSTEKLKQLSQMRARDFVQLRIEVIAESSGDQGKFAEWLNVMNGNMDALGQDLAQINQFIAAFDGIYVDVYSGDSLAGKVLDENYKHIDWTDDVKAAYRRMLKTREDMMLVSKGLTMKSLAGASGGRYNRYMDNGASYSFLGGTVLTSLDVKNQGQLETTAHEVKGLRVEQAAFCAQMENSAEIKLFDKSYELNELSKPHNQYCKTIKAIGEDVDKEAAEPASLYVGLE